MPLPFFKKIRAMEEAIKKAAVLIEALPYIQAFRDKIIVIKFGGSAMTDEGILSSVLQDVVFMESVGMRPVLVHGGGPYITEEMAKKGKEPRFLEGHRVTDKETLDIAIDVLVNRVSASIASKIASLGGSGVCTWHNGKSLLKAEKYLLETKDEAGSTRLLDLGFVGRVTQMDKQTFYEICKAGKIPVVPPIAQGQNGEMFNINADSAAAFIAESLKAEKIVFLSNTHGIMTDPKKENSFASTLHEKEVYTLIEQKIITGGMLPKARACISALLAGVKKAHIIDGRIPHSLLLEIFTDKGIGTQIIV